MSNQADTTEHWSAALEGIASRGAISQRPRSLARLHEVRREHLGQFWNPELVARFIWRLIDPVIERARASDPGLVAVLDNAVGIGRFFTPGDPQRVQLAVFDVDAAAVEAVRAAQLLGES